MRLISCLPDGAAPLTQISLMTDLCLMSQRNAFSGSSTFRGLVMSDWATKKTAQLW